MEGKKCSKNNKHTQAHTHKMNLIACLGQNENKDSLLLCQWEFYCTGHKFINKYTPRSPC